MIDLSKNIHYDEVFLGQVQTCLSSLNIANNEQPCDDGVSGIISSYYNIHRKNLSIGFGSGDVLKRVIDLSEVDHLYVVEPTFRGAMTYACNKGITYIPLNYNNFNEISLLTFPKNGIIYIANPNGNNGHCFKKQDLLKIVERNKLTILDEAYIEFGGESLMANVSDKLIVLRTFSKSLGMPNIRCGFAVSSESNIKKLRKHDLIYNSTNLAYHILKEKIDQIPLIVDRMKQGKDFLQQNFSHIKSDGNYVLLDSKHADTFSKFCKFSTRGDYLRIALTNTRLLKECLQKF
jgi:histidinol-phosphate/aromatic aminotransferase/cobyric acid decarboxylase-like protein